MQRTDEFRNETLIDLGAASVETKGDILGQVDDTAPKEPFRDGGIAAE